MSGKKNVVLGVLVLALIAVAAVYVSRDSTLAQEQATSTQYATTTSTTIVTQTTSSTSTTIKATTTTLTKTTTFRWEEFPEINATFGFKSDHISVYLDTEGFYANITNNGDKKIFGVKVTATTNGGTNLLIKPDVLIMEPNETKIVFIRVDANMVAENDTITLQMRAGNKIKSERISVERIMSKNSSTKKKECNCSG